MRTLSKSRLIAHRQCAKRLWLEVNRPELKSESGATQALYAGGHAVGDLARALYDPDGTGTLIDAQAEGYSSALGRSEALLDGAAPIFEAGYTADGAIFFADVMERETRDGIGGWRIVEVKSSGGVKDYHRDDAAIQAYIARRAGVTLTSIAVAHIDTAWVYPGNGDYRGLLREVDVTPEAFAAWDEVERWIADAQATLALADEPAVRWSRHCSKPYDCGYVGHCKASEPDVDAPSHWLPDVRKAALKSAIHEDYVRGMDDIPDALLNPLQLRVKRHTLSGTRFFDQEAAAAALAGLGYPASFLDFETIMFAIPIWAGTRPFTQIPFQFSLHVVSGDGSVDHSSFLELTGSDPSRGLAEALVKSCPVEGPVFAYYASFEKGVIESLAEANDDLSDQLRAIAARLVDLLPVVKSHFYDPLQRGSWSIKKVLPAIAPDLSYDALEGVQDGAMAMAAYLEAVAPGTSPARKSEIGDQLDRYCALDTFAMIRLWEFLRGVTASELQAA